MGDLGETEVDVNFQRIGWAPCITFRQDIGDDLMTVARDQLGNDLGLPVVVQVKSSSEKYAATVSELNGQPGWWHTEEGFRHFDHWVRHGLPYLLVLHDLASHRSYWAHVTGESVVTTGKGLKVFVPQTQQIDPDNVEALLAVAASGRASTNLEGSVWKGGLDNLAPSDRIRHALIAPGSWLLIPTFNPTPSPTSRVSPCSFASAFRI